MDESQAIILDVIAGARAGLPRMGSSVCLPSVGAGRSKECRCGSTSCAIRGARVGAVQAFLVRVFNLVQHWR
jgi:hypothetical protein